MCIEKHFKGGNFHDARVITTGNVPVNHEHARAYRLYHEDCIKTMNKLPPNSVDAVVSDPPYGLGFMGKLWDALPPGPDFAKAALRVLKPGGHIIAFGGTRTMHRLTVALEDVGFEIRDSIHWCYWSGFPHGMNISAQFDKQTVRDNKTGELVFRGNMDEIYLVTAGIAAARDEAGLTNKAIDEALGFVGMAGHWTTQASQPQIPNWEQWAQLKQMMSLADEHELDDLVWRLNGRKGQPGDAWTEREVVGQHENPSAASVWRENVNGDEPEEPQAITEPLTENAKAWHGWNTALKPSVEPAILARKPISEKTIAANILRWGVGGINVDASRMSETDSCWPGPKPNTKSGKLDPRAQSNPDKATGAGSGSGAEVYGYRRAIRYGAHPDGWWPANLYYCSKPSKKEREAGLDDFEAKLRMPDLDETKDWVGGHNAYLCGGAVKRRNNHPTVKPIKLMRWLCRLVCPPGGVVLDPFMGSGTTGCAAMLEGFDFIGCELYPLPPEHDQHDPKNNVDAFGISAARIEYWRDEAEKNAWANAFGSITGQLAMLETE